MQRDLLMVDDITVVWWGGHTTRAYLTLGSGRPSTVTEEDRRTPVTLLISGSPLPEPGQEYVLFLGDGGIGIVPGRYFVPVGLFQGTFTVADGRVRRWLPPDFTAVTPLDLSLADVEASLR